MNRAKQIFVSLAVLAAAPALSACANDRGPYPTLPNIGMRAIFASKNLCGLGVSPEIALGGVPQNAAIYRLRISEVSTLNGPRWQWEIPATPAAIAEGSLQDFDLPCPGEKQVLSYRFEIMALSQDRQPLGYGWTFASAVSLPEQISREQRIAKSGGIQALPPPSPWTRPNFFIQ